MWSRLVEANCAWLAETHFNYLSGTFLAEILIVLLGEFCLCRTLFFVFKKDCQVFNLHQDNVCCQNPGGNLKFVVASKILNRQRCPFMKPSGINNSLFLLKGILHS